MISNHFFTIDEIKNSIFYGDCFHILPFFPPRSIDLIISDMPYNLTQITWENEVDLNQLWKLYLPLIKPNGVICLFGSQPFTSKVVSSNLTWFKYEWIWHKDRPSNFPLAKYQPLKYHEEIVVFYHESPIYHPQMIPRISRRIEQGQKSGNDYFKRYPRKVNTIFSGIHEQKDIIRYSDYDTELKYPSSVIEMPKITPNAYEKTIHPTQKPVRLYEYLIKTYTDEGMLVLDSFAGSGTNAVACLNTKRKFV